MNSDKLKQYVALIGGVLSALFLFFQSIGINFERFNELSIESFIALLTALVPLVLVIYGVYKNTYIVTKKAKEEEKILKGKDLN